MKYYSLNNPNHQVDFRAATIKGQADDKGLYFPSTIPLLNNNFFERLPKMSDAEMGLEVISPYVGDCIPEADLQQIVAETLHFPVPLVPLTERMFSLEMFHGNTLAFKDIGARFMSRCLGYFVKGHSEKITVLVATSGDTGGAVADGFYGVDGVEVVILYPSGKVSNVQEKQLTTLGKNINAIEVLGNFDDCQRLVKTAFADETLRNNMFLTSANSINVARWLPQQFFYFLACKQWADSGNPPVICVPSGNFGNICAGLLAWKSGLPVRHFIAACNANDVVPQFMQTKQYQPRKAVATISNAMDVGDPSNFIRILRLFDQQHSELEKIFSSVSVSEDETRAAIKQVYDEIGYLLDPHGAVGYVALKQYLQDHPEHKGLFAETAHPVKFYDAVEPVTGNTIPLPAAIEAIIHKPKKAECIEPKYEALRDLLKGMA